MKKLLFILLLPIQLFAQVEFLETAQVEFRGLVTIQDTIYYDNTEIFAKLELLPESVKAKGDKEVVFFPVKKYYTPAPRYLILFGIYYAQFTYDVVTEVVTLEQPDVWLTEYSFKTKKFKKEKKYKGDTYDIFRPENIEKKIKDKMKEKEKPGAIDPGDTKPKGKDR